MKRYSMKGKLVNHSTRNFRREGFEHGFDAGKNRKPDIPKMVYLFYLKSSQEILVVTWKAWVVFRIYLQAYILQILVLAMMLVTPFSMKVSKAPIKGTGLLRLTKMHFLRSDPGVNRSFVFCKLAIIWIAGWPGSPRPRQAGSLKRAEKLKHGRAFKTYEFLQPARIPMFHCLEILPW